MKLEYGFVILVLVALILSAGCLTGTVSLTPEPVTYQQPMKVVVEYTYSEGYSQQTQNPTKTIPPIQTFRIGESATDGKGKLTINSVTFKDKLGSYTPDWAKGKKYLIVDVTYENLQQNNVVTAYLWDLLLTDSDGYSYEPAFDSSIENIYKGTDILPQEKRRGNMLYVVPPNATGLKLRYNFGNGYVAVYNLQ